MEARQTLPLDPERVREPTSHNSTSLRLIVLQMCAISGFAALVAWAVVSLLAPKQTANGTAQIKSPSQPIVGNSAKLVPAQSLIAVPPPVHAAAAGARESSPGVSASTLATNEPLQRPDLVPALHDQRRPSEIGETPAANNPPPQADATPGKPLPRADTAAAPTANQSLVQRKMHPAPHLNLSVLRLATNPCCLMAEKSPCWSSTARI